MGICYLSNNYTKSAKVCVDRLNNTSVMRKLRKVFLNPFGMGANVEVLRISRICDSLMRNFHSTLLGGVEIWGKRLTTGTVNQLIKSWLQTIGGDRILRVFYFTVHSSFFKEFFWLGLKIGMDKNYIVNGNPLLRVTSNMMINPWVCKA